MMENTSNYMGTYRYMEVTCFFGSSPWEYASQQAKYGISAAIGDIDGLSFVTFHVDG